MSASWFFLGGKKMDTFALLCLAKNCGLHVRGIDVCGYGYIHGFLWKSCGYGYGWEILSLQIAAA